MINILEQRRLRKKYSTIKIQKGISKESYTENGKQKKKQKTKTRLVCSKSLAFLKHLQRRSEGSVSEHQSFSLFTLSLEIISQFPSSLVDSEFPKDKWLANVSQKKLFFILCPAVPSEKKSFNEVQAAEKFSVKTEVSQLKRRYYSAELGGYFGIVSSPD